MPRGSVEVARIDDARLSGEVVHPAVIDVGDERVKAGVHTGEDEGEVGECCAWCSAKASCCVELVTLSESERAEVLAYMHLLRYFDLLCAGRVKRVCFQNVEARHHNLALFLVELAAVAREQPL